MSTRANIVVRDEHDLLWFYRHSDGHPDGTMPTLQKFVDLVAGCAIRSNVGQAAGWLVVIGAIEYQTLTPDAFPQGHIAKSWERDQDAAEYALRSFEPSDWKVGAYEPTVGCHGDIDYAYIVDLHAREVRGYNAGKNWDPSSPGEPIVTYITYAAPKAPAHAR